MEFYRRGRTNPFNDVLTRLRNNEAVSKTVTTVPMLPVKRSRRGEPEVTHRRVEGKYIENIETSKPRRPKSHVEVSDESEEEEEPQEKKKKKETTAKPVASIEETMVAALTTLTKEIAELRSNHNNNNKNNPSHNWRPKMQIRRQLS